VSVKDSGENQLSGIWSLESMALEVRETYREEVRGWRPPLPIL
jgi:hypothetical protein